MKPANLAVGMALVIPTFTYLGNDFSEPFKQFGYAQFAPLASVSDTGEVSALTTRVPDFSGFRPVTREPDRCTDRFSQMPSACEGGRRP